jgi:hypothetical protein
MFGVDWLIYQAGQDGRKGYKNSDINISTLKVKKINWGEGGGEETHHKIIYKPPLN